MLNQSTSAHGLSAEGRVVAMLHRYRVLSAILALREFTVADIAHYSATKDATVRTVLSREARYVERAGYAEHGRRGGQAIRYRLCPDTEHELRAILRDLESIGTDRSASAVDEDADSVILSLTAAEDLLLRQLPAASVAERARLLELALTDFGMVLPLIAQDQRDPMTHRAVVELLIGLAEVEQEALVLTAPADTSEWLSRQQASAMAAPSHDAEKKLHALGRDFYTLLADWPALQDKQLLPDLMHRISSSPFGSIILTAHAGAATAS
jgi:hypothetical protein